MSTSSPKAKDVLPMYLYQPLRAKKQWMIYTENLV